MAVSKLILGMNARNFLFLNRYNRAWAKKIADDKLSTKERLLEADIPTTKLLASFEHYDDVRHFDWGSLPSDFVLKPARGYGGEGIIVVRKWDGERGTRTDGSEISHVELESEIFDIIDGAHSIDNLADRAFFEERVIVQTSFRKISAGGVPDVRVIVCNKVPIMAMLRLPTQSSGGRANLHMGAIGIGIDLRTGITTKGIIRNVDVVNIPNSKTKVHGIKVPCWDKILEISSRAQEKSGLGYAGIDLVIDERHGPLVLEVNARPGLTIQLANGESLRTRLERVAGLSVGSVAKGIDIAQEIFAEPELAELPSEDNILHVIEKIQIYGKGNKRKTVLAKIDTGAFRSALDAKLVEELELDRQTQKIRITAGSGSQVRETVKVEFKLRGKDISTVATYLNREHMRFPVIVGRRDLQGFLVDPSAVRDTVQ